MEYTHGAHTRVEVAYWSRDRDRMVYSCRLWYVSGSSLVDIFELETVTAVVDLERLGGA